LHYREWLRLVGRLVALRPDVVQLGDLRFAGDALCVGLLAALGLRLTEICHNVERFAGGRFASTRLERAAYRWLYRRCRRVFVHYESNRARFLALHGGDPSRVVAIPHGNEAVFAAVRRPDVGAADLRRRLGLGSEAQVILQLGTMSTYKGCDLALEALPRVRQRVPTAHLVLAGRPLPDFDLGALADRVAELGLARHVSLIPHYVPSDEVAAWLELAAVAFFPYREVFQSGALALAQTFGVPCVATRVGAMAEAAGDGALMVAAPANPEALAGALTRVLADRELAAELGAAGRQQAMTGGDWTAIGVTLRREYEALLADRPVAARSVAEAGR
ncbi:MAG: glycosyltransferase family 4 protein, partial [Thermoanaerobaculia bacterium]